MTPISDGKSVGIAENAPESSSASLPDSAIVVSKLSKIYAGGHAALTDIDLEIRKGEIFALLGPNGAGKTTLISIICGIVNPTSGRITAGGDDVIRDYRKTRAKIGLVPQELTTDAFETVWNTVTFSRGLFGKKPNPAIIERILRDLSLWDRKDSKIITLSGGMKRRVLIAKALSHEPEILFLDEPTAGVDVELRRGMWDMVRKLQKTGVTIILTTHYIEEAEEMADRIGVINGGRIVLVEDKSALMKKLGKKELRLNLHTPMEIIPAEISGHALALEDDGNTLVFTFDTQAERTGTTRLLADLDRLEVRFSDLDTRQSTLEDIFVSVVGESS
ncbi:MAG: ABC-2 type transport system ATP-binding protein [Paracoccaceae bacterium]|jgi:ABC-2 type transport system ATP-binding protein